MLSVILLSVPKCDQAFDLWQKLQLAAELESHLRHTVDWGREWLEKLSLISFDRFLRKNHLLRC